MNIEDFKKEVLAHYMDAEMLVSIDRDPGKWSSGNLPLHTGLFYQILAINNAVTETDTARFGLAADKLWVEDDNGKTWRGLLWRNYKRNDLEAHDNYIGVVAASSYLSTQHACDIYNYGKDHSWCFDNQRPDAGFNPSRWHGRFPGLVGFYCLAVNEPPGWIQTIMINKWLSCGPNGVADQDFRQWMMAQLIKRKSSRFNEAYDEFQEKFRKQWGSLGCCLAQYFKEAHPFAQIHSLTGEIK